MTQPTTPPPTEPPGSTLHEMPAVPPAGAAPSGPPIGSGAGKPRFHRPFLTKALVAAGVLALAVLLVFGLVFGLGNDWDDLPASTRLAATLAVPLVVLGVVLVCAGAALAATEWRGTMKDQEELRSRGFDGMDKIIDSVGKLRGPALLMVVGALLLGGSAWVASSAAEAPASETPSSSEPAGD